MDWKVAAAVIAALVLVIGFGMESYKKWLRDDKAGKREIILVAALLSVTLTASFAFGLGFPGLPWTFPGYAIGIFLLQWFIDQKAIKRICKAIGLFGKAKLKEYGVAETDMGVLDE
ncbi:MAG: hypothetical protein AB7C91_13640 [Sphaerochaeta sp.]|uniref:hypothetical protein n=1 Tax=Sphaerochaeta sp. TaxID=1972642 RepID=UPI003D122BD9